MATILNKTGANAFVISFILGHRINNITEVYAKSDLEMQYEAIIKAWKEFSKYFKETDYWWK